MSAKIPLDDLKLLAEAQAILIKAQDKVIEALEKELDSNRVHRFLQEQE